MSVAVLIPFASNELWRVRARDHVVGWWAAGGYSVTEGTCEGPWRKAAAVADAAARTTADILVIADADVIADRAVVATTVGAVEAGVAWAMPHGKVHRLNQAATEAVYSGIDPAGTTGRTQSPYTGWAGGGIVVVPRRIWELIPMDPRFCGWSGEDESWAHALTCLAGPCFRLNAALYHLWHPPQPRISRRWGSLAARTLTRRYSVARHDPDQMRALVDEARSAFAEVAAA